MNSSLKYISGIASAFIFFSCGDQDPRSKFRPVKDVSKQLSFEPEVEVPGFKAVEDIVSMQRTNNPDEYSVLCANGSKEIVTTIDLQLNNVCPHKNIGTLGNILSMQRRDDGRFDVICRQTPTSISIYSAQQIRDGVACADPKPSDRKPVITLLGRMSDLEDAIENSPVTIESGGSWNLKWSVNDIETPTDKLEVTVRRKIATSSTDIPKDTDSVYISGSGTTLTKLRQETAWVSTSVTNKGKFVNYLITVKDAAGNSTSQSFSVNNNASCPSGYVGVPGNSTAGLGSPLATIGNTTGSLDPSRAFCVMKYPAKNVSSVAKSVAWGTPWVNITRNTAATTCSSLGTGFGLISNTQWQVVARNAENVASNWSGGAVGTGVLNRGHSDRSPDSALANTADDTDGYFGTGNTGFTSAAWSGLGARPAAGTEQKRTYILSNGKVVWDFGGNVLQWVNDNYSTLSMSPAISVGSAEFSNTRNFPVSGVNRLNFAPAGSFNSSRNSGQLYGGSAGAVQRGSFWQNASYGGLFAANLSNGPTYTEYTTIGFRCSFLP